MTSITSSEQWLVTIATALLAMGCGGEPTNAELDAAIIAGPLSLTRDIQPILNEHCVRCHAYGASDPHGEPHFTPDSSSLAMRTTSDCTSGGSRVPLVVAGDPEGSFLMFKLGAATRLSITGTPCVQMMPLRGDAPLAETDPDTVAQIRQWIVDGAR